MKSLLIISLAGLLVLSCQSNTTNLGLDPTDRLRTASTEDWDNWTLSLAGESGRFRTASAEDWDNWTYDLDGETGRIRTNSSEDWDNWQLNNGAFRIRTSIANDWDGWEIVGNGLLIKVKTSIPNDWDAWTVSGDFNATFRTSTTEDWDNWELQGDWSSLDASTKAAILFIPVFTSSIYTQGIHL